MSVLQVIGDSIVHAAGTPFEALGFRLDETLELQLHERMIGILGATGSGKSSFLSILANQAVGFSALYGGEVLHPPKVGLVFQQPEDQLFLATVKEELSYAPANLGCALPDEAQMLKLLQTVGFSNPDVILPQDPMKLSGGEKRRVALASILAMQPEILVLDEPFAGLDPHNMGLILRLFLSLKRSGLGIIFTGHQACEMSLFCDEILGFQEQKIHCRGEPRSILPWLIEYSGLEFFQKWLDLVQSGRDKAERDYLKQFRRIYA